MYIVYLQRIFTLPTLQLDYKKTYKLIAQEYFGVITQNNMIFFVASIKSVLAYNLRASFFADMQFSQNGIAHYGALKTQKSNVTLIKMPNVLLFIQTCLVYPIMQTTNAASQNTALSLFRIYGKISSCKKLRKPTKQFLKKMCCRWTGRQTDGQMKRTDFIGPFHKDEGLIMFFRNSRIQFS